MPRKKAGVSTRGEGVTPRVVSSPRTAALLASFMCDKVNPAQKLPISKLSVAQWATLRLKLSMSVGG